jgi:uncharacterized membrane protein YedE/YeeE
MTTTLQPTPHPLLVAAAAAALGALFGLGLHVGGMTDPTNVQSFLDLFGAWRPQLMGVMGGGMAVAALLYAVARRRDTPLLALRWRWPDATAIDAPLLAGSALFGIGWALAGFCPGPALVAMGSGSTEAALFVAAMLAGGWLQRAGATLRKG